MLGPTCQWEVILESQLDREEPEEDSQYDHRQGKEVTPLGVANDGCQAEGDTEQDKDHWADEGGLKQ